MEPELNGQSFAWREAYLRPWMVLRGCGALAGFGSGYLAAGALGGDLLHLAAEGGLVHDQLGGDHDEVADVPVEGEAGGVLPGEVAGEEGHDEGHHLLLLRIDAGGGGVELGEEGGERP